MAFGRFLSRNTDHAIERLDGSDCGAIARLHDDGFGRPWTDGEFASLLSQETVFGYAVRRTGRPGDAPLGFVLARLVAGEAEILTITVARANRGAGLGRALMEAVLRHLHAERAETLFLEVDEANGWALSLYRRLGFREVARRAGYYSSGEGGRGNALVMRLDLR